LEYLFLPFRIARMFRNVLVWVLMPLSTPTAVVRMFLFMKNLLLSYIPEIVTVRRCQINSPFISLSLILSGTAAGKINLTRKRSGNHQAKRKKGENPIRTGILFSCSSEAPL
jgi:hypothetical protein